MEVAAPEAPDESSNQSSVVKSEDGSAQQDGGRSSPPPNCAICLGRCHNKSFTDSCLHQFCFKCLVTWSRVKSECPLCKQVFKSIIHNVKSNHQYEEYPVDQPGNVSGINDVSERLYHAARRFRYRTTLTLPGNQTLDAIQQLLLHYPMTVMDNRERERRRPERRTSADFRRTVYRHNLWARPLPDFTGRYRDCTPEFFRFNDSQIHRLVPWLSRELYYLLNENAGHIAYVLERIVEMLPRHAITSREFRAALFCYFGERTEHFLHEFHCFASTPYDITGYDRHVQYGTDARVAQVLSGSESDSRDSDIVMVSSSHPAPAPAPAAPAPGPSRVTAPADVVPIETISHSDSDSSEVMVVGYIKPPHQRTPELVDLVNSDSDVVMQEPGDTPLVRLTLSRARRPASPTRTESGEEASHTPVRAPRRRLRPRLSPPPLSSSSSSCGTATPPFSSDDEDSREDSPESSSSADGRRHRHRRRRPRQRRERTRRMTKKRSRRQNERERNRSSDRSRSVTVDPPLVTASCVVSSPEPDRDPAPVPCPAREPRPTAVGGPSVAAAADTATVTTATIPTAASIASTAPTAPTAPSTAHRDGPSRSGSKRRAADEADPPRSSRESKRLKSVVMRPTDSSPDSSRSLASTITNSSSRTKRQPVDDTRDIDVSRNNVTKRNAERSVNSRTDERRVTSRTGERSVTSRTGERSVSSWNDERSTNSRTDEQSVTSRSDERSVTSQTDERSAHSRTDERSVNNRSDELSVTRRTDERSVTSRDDNRSVRDDRSRSGDTNRSDRRSRSDVTSACNVRSAKDDINHSAVRSVRGDRNRSGDTTRNDDRSRNGHKSIRDEVNRSDVRGGDRSRGDARSIGDNRSHSGNSNPSVVRTCNVVRNVHDDRAHRSDTNHGDGRSRNGVTSASDVRNNTILNGNSSSTQVVDRSESDSSSSFDENIPLNLAIAKYITIQRRQENASK